MHFSKTIRGFRVCPAQYPYLYRSLYACVLLRRTRRAITSLRHVLWQEKCRNYDYGSVNICYIYGIAVPGWLEKLWGGHVLYLFVSAVHEWRRQLTQIVNTNMSARYATDDVEMQPPVSSSVHRTRKPSLEVAPITLATFYATEKSHSGCYLFTVLNSDLLLLFFGSRHATEAIFGDGPAHWAALWISLRYAKTGLARTGQRNHKSDGSRSPR